VIDHRAVIDPSAKIASDVHIGPYAIIGPNVEIGSGTQLGPHVYIHSNTKIGRNNKIDAFAALGGDPQHTNFNGEPTFLEIGDHNVIREFCTFNRGTTQGEGVTRVGNHNFFMAYAHIAHDCIVGNCVTLANNASLAGHVHVEDFVGFSAFCGVHQFVTIGAYSFLGRATKVGQDVPPYMLVTGNPGAPKGLNLIGLKRRGFNEQTIRAFKRAYSLVYRQSLRLQEALAELKKMVPHHPEIQRIIDAIQRSKRGIAR
jgi:UDP-N-acetylglucosamine acyltransferase